MLELAICDDDIILCNWLEQKLLHYGKANDCQISVEIYYSAKQQNLQMPMILSVVCRMDTRQCLPELGKI